MKPNRRSILLRAAGRLLERLGAPAFTLSAVAQEASVSKGGLLYHFPTKDALIEALIAALIDGFDARRERAALAHPGPGGAARGYLYGALEDDSAPLQGAIAAAVAHDPSLLSPLRLAYVRWQHALTSDGLDPAVATLVRLAVDGLWVSDLLGLEPLPEDLQERVVSLLDAMTREVPS